MVCEKTFVQSLNGSIFCGKTDSADEANVAGVSAEKQESVHRNLKAKSLSFKSTVCFQIVDK